MRFTSQTPAAAAWRLPGAGASTASASSWGDNYAGACSDEDMDCAEISENDAKGNDARNYCLGKAAETAKKGKAGYWGLGRLWAGFIAELCFDSCMKGYVRCLSEFDERPVARDVEPSV